LSPPIASTAIFIEIPCNIKGKGPAIPSQQHHPFAFEQSSVYIC
jgi:hypothetical protein